MVRYSRKESKLRCFELKDAKVPLPSSKAMVFVGHPCTCLINFGGESKQNKEMNNGGVWYEITFLRGQWVFVSTV
jgi:hypothetical protein